MRECKTCGTILDGLNSFGGTSRHDKRCRRSTPAERAEYKRTGLWPRKGWKPRKAQHAQLPPEVPEAPPLGAV